jgi:hypothetical protein
LTRGIALSLNPNLNLPPYQEGELERGSSPLSLWAYYTTVLVEKGGYAEPRGSKG